LKELLPLTGYVHGGCSPIGLKKPFPVFMDETAQLFDTVCISAGKRGYQVEVAPLDLQKYPIGLCRPRPLIGRREIAEKLSDLAQNVQVVF
jgi:Cys-tRNA(Pro) deacylase